MSRFHIYGLIVAAILTSVSFLMAKEEKGEVDQQKVEEALAKEKEDAEEREQENIERLKKQNEALEKYVPMLKKPGKGQPKKTNKLTDDARLLAIERGLLEKERLLKQREDQLNNLEKDILGEIETLKKERKLFDDSRVKEQKLRQERLKKLTKMYSKMAAKKAAIALEKMEKTLAIQIILNLKEKIVSSLFEKMSTDKVIEYSEALAGHKRKQQKP